MINKLLDFCIRERMLVFSAMVVVFAYGWYSTQKVPLDAIPNVGENQVIVLAEWMGRSPKDMEDQVTYPLSIALQAVPGEKACAARACLASVSSRSRSTTTWTFTGHVPASRSN